VEEEVDALTLPAIQTILLLLLLLVAACALLAERVKVPYPIVLLLAGLGLSFVPHVPRVPLKPELVFLVFLPPLLYHSAWLTSWREFKMNMVSIVMLAVGLVTFTVVGIALFADHVIAALDWKSGLLLGAVVATTDAIAATAIGKRIGLPKGIMDLLEGESLVNDATGLLALEFGVLIVVQGQTPTIGMAIGRFIWLIVGGVGVGLLVGALVVWLERFVDDAPVEIVISLVTPYAAYLIGERVGASGVLSVVACGLLVSRRGNEYFSPAARMQVAAVWRSLDFVLNGLVFCLIGLQLPYVLSGMVRGYSWVTLLKYGAGFSAFLIVLRLVWMFPGAWVAHWLRTRWLGQKRAAPSAKGTFVLGWTGMRGVVTLAAAIGLPYQLADGRPFVQRDLIVFLAFCVILVTLVGQGLTLPMLIRALGMAGVDTAIAEERKIARATALEAAIAWLNEERAKAETASWPAIDNMLKVYQGRWEALCGPKPAESGAQVAKVQELARGAARQQRQALLKLRAEGRVGDEAMRSVERELDLMETRLDTASF
jgi:Na+/H+ antiporter